MDHFRTLLAIFAIRTVGHLPFTWTRRLGRLMGFIALCFNTRMVSTTRTNLKKCLPHLSKDEQQRLIRSSIYHTGMLSGEVCWLFTNPRAWDYHCSNIEGLDVVRTALDRGKGLMVLAPHLGNWEVLGLFLTTLAPVTNLYQPPKLKGLEPLIRKSREQTGASLVPTTAKGVSALLKTLKAGGISGILPDQNPNDRSGGEFSPFFGHDAFTMTLIHKLLVKTGAQAVLAYAKRLETGFELVFRAVPTDLYSEDPATSLRGLNKGIEDLILEAPEQYQWEYKRFKIQPETSPAFYD